MIYGKLIRKGYAIIFSFNIFLLLLQYFFSVFIVFTYHCDDAVWKKTNNGYFYKNLVCHSNETKRRRRRDENELEIIKWNIVVSSLVHFRRLALIAFVFFSSAPLVDRDNHEESN